MAIGTVASVLDYGYRYCIGFSYLMQKGTENEEFLAYSVILVQVLSDSISATLGFSGEG